MASFSWAKVPISELDDRRIASLPDSAWRRYHECTLLAKEEDNGGLLPDAADMAWRLRITEEALLNDLAYLARAGLVELAPLEGGGEAWAVTDFEANQGATSSTERSRQSRQRRRSSPSSETDDTTPQRTCNDAATTPQRNVAQNKRREEKNEDKRREGEGEQTGATAPAPTPLPSIPFQPVPEAIIAAKRRRGDPEPSTAVPNAPPGVALLHRLTNYWPGADITPALADRLGDAPDEAALGRAVELWRLSGNKPTNWLGILDWYDQLRADLAWTPQARFKANGQGNTNGRAPLSPSEQAAAQYAAAKRQLLGGK